MVPGTAANTVIWYTGETGDRSGAFDRDGTHRSVAVGLIWRACQRRRHPQSGPERRDARGRAQFRPSNPNGVAPEQRLDQRLTVNLGAPGTQTITDIESDLATAQTSLQAAKVRHQQTSSTLSDFLQQIDGVSNEDVGAQLLTLQTRMQASMQVTVDAVPDQSGELPQVAGLAAVRPQHVRTNKKTAARPRSFVSDVRCRRQARLSSPAANSRLMLISKPRPSGRGFARIASV